MSSARVGLPVPEVAERFARSRDALIGFEASAGLDWLPPGRRRAVVQVMAVRANGTRFVLDRSTVSLPPRANRREGASRAVSPCAAVHDRDLRDGLLLDENGHPCKLAFVHIPRTAWCPLADVDENNGCLAVVPGSHRVFNQVGVSGFGYQPGTRPEGAKRLGSVDHTVQPAQAEDLERLREVQSALAASRGR